MLVSNPQGDPPAMLLCVKPGFVRTEMTDGLAALPFAGRPDRTASQGGLLLGRLL